MSKLSLSDVTRPQIDFEAVVEKFRAAEPFDHIVIDDFFTEEVANGLVQEFPEFNSKVWWEYDNPIEIKKACNA